MASNVIHGRIFVVKFTEPSDADSRAVRRIVVHADVLSAAKLYAGDVVALIGTVNEAEESKVRTSTSTPSWVNRGHSKYGSVLFTAVCCGGYMAVHGDISYR